MNDVMNDIQLGIEAQRFKESKLGIYLNDRAESEIIDATQELCEVTPTDIIKITELQNKVYRANSFITWIFDAIENGEFSQAEMRTNDD